MSDATIGAQRTVFEERHLALSTTDRWRSALRILLRHKSALIGGIVLLLVIAVALAAPLLSSANPRALDPLRRLQKPSAYHLFGTDNVGRDVYSRTLWGARVSLQVGFGTALVTLLFGTIFGLIAGYYRRIDTTLMRVMDSMMAFPGIILAIGIMAAVGPSKWNVIVALSVVSTPRLARLVRSVVLSIREMQFVEAAIATGMGSGRIMWRHILPNCLSPLIVQATFIFAEAVIGEATLSFLGAGIPPDIPSWGIMLGEARSFLRDAPWTMLFPGAILTLTVLALNLLGDGIRDMLDPRLRKM